MAALFMGGWLSKIHIRATNVPPPNLTVYKWLGRSLLLKRLSVAFSMKRPVYESWLNDSGKASPVLLDWMDCDGQAMD